MSKTVLVVGASGGIGRSISNDISKLGHDLYVTGSTLSTIEMLKHELQCSGVFKLDLCMTNDIEELVAALPLLDGIVIASGIQYYMPVKFVKKDLAFKMMEVNFWGPVFLIQSLLKKGKIKEGSSIILISSVSSKLGVKGQSIYAASKSALIGYMRSLANELSTKKIRVNCISPGLIKTDLVGKMNQSLDQATIDADLKRYPLGIGEPNYLNGLVNYLIDDSSYWMTGQNFVIDGGLTLY